MMRQRREVFCKGLAPSRDSGHVRLSDEEAAAWRRDLEDARKVLLPLVDKW